MVIGQSDQKVIAAFTEKRAAEGNKLTTDGKRLDGHWMGGRGIAEWKGGQIHLADLGSRAAQTVHRAVRRWAAPIDMADYKPFGARRKNHRYYRGG